MAGKKTYIFEVEMLKLSDKLEINIEAESDVARDTFFKKFLTDKDERYFYHEPTNKSYHKDYIYGYTYKGVK